MHPSEAAQQIREASWNRELSIPKTAPGTSHEWEALAAIDDARKAEERDQRNRGRRAVVRIDR